MNDRMVMHNNEITQNNNQGQRHEQRLNQHLAPTTVLCAAPYRANEHGNPDHQYDGKRNKTIVTLAAGTLAFYAVQSFTCNVWRPIFDNAIYTMATGIQTGTPRPAGAILLGILMSLCLALALLLMDIAGP